MFYLFVLGCVSLREETGILFSTWIPIKLQKYIVLPYTTLAVP